MPTLESGLFSTVAPEDYFNIFNPNGEPDAKEITRLLDYKKKDISVATDIPVSQIRFDNQIPKEFVNRAREWGTALNLVCSHFQDTKKTVLWFQTPNPMLGNISPRQMIIVGRFNKLLKFVQTALSQNL